MNKKFLMVASLTSTVAFAQNQKPNIMLILVDDMGYSDPGCFGGEIQTPNIDSLAKDGLRFTQFFNCSRSCPSRAALLTGLYPQECGITGMGLSLSSNCVTIAEALKLNGYNTAMTGKWHLSLTQAQSTYENQMKWLAHQANFGNFAPLASYPCNRGFDEHWGIIWGVADYFDPFSLVHNETPIETVPNDFYMTDFVTDKTVELIDSYSKKSEPYFMYVAYTAPHWPLQAKPADIAKYKGKYDGGWDELRKNRYQKMLELGLISESTMPPARNESGRLWQNESRKSWEASNMEVHAAMVDCVDQGIGKIIAKLKATGQYDNTLIVFMSDNGASPERYNDSGFDRPSMMRNGTPYIYPNNYPTPGPQTSMGALGDAWAGAVNTPYRYWKSESFHGGTTTPMIVHWPAGLKTQPGSITKQVGHVIDIMPTCLDLAGASYPTTYKGVKILPEEGRSLKPILEGQTIGEDTIYWEHEGGRAVRAGNWRLVSLKNANWQLFNLAEDLSETKNVAVENPEKVIELKTLWNAWARKVGLTVPVEIGDTPLQLAFYYPFNGDLKDGSVNNYTLTSPNGQSFVQGKFGQALSLNGTNQYLDLNTTGIVNPQTTQFSVCAWINNAATTVPAAGILYEEVVLAQKDGSGDAAGRIALYTRHDGPNTYFNNFLSANPNLSNPNAFRRNEWMHVAVVCDPSTRAVSYYVNGKKDTTCYAKGAFESCTGGFRIGAHKANKNYWTGKMDELYLFKGLLSETDINKVMNNTYEIGTSLGNVQNEPSLEIYHDAPNRFLHISCGIPIKDVILYTLSGQKVKVKWNKNQLSTDKLDRGVYIVRVLNADGGSISRTVAL
jgi:arylsulfatase